MFPGAMEMGIILILVLVVFGAGRLPDVFRDLGKGVKALREAAEGDDAPKAKQIDEDDEPER